MRKESRASKNLLLLALMVGLALWSPSARAADDDEEEVKEIIDVGLSEIPVVGGLVSALFDAVWEKAKPRESVDYWAAVRGEVIDEIQRQVNQALDDQTFNAKEAILEGLRAETSVYVGERRKTRENWHDLKSALLRDVPQFQQRDRELVLLPLYVQVVNLQLAVLRDCVLFGKDQFKMTDQDVEDCYSSSTTHQGLADLIEAHTAYAYSIYQAGRDRLPTAGQALAYDATMAYSVLDFVDRWRYFDPEKYPQVPEPLIDTRELFAGPDGWPSGNNFPASMFPTSEPFDKADLSLSSGKLTQVEIWRQGRNQQQQDMQNGVNRARATYGTTPGATTGAGDDRNNYLAAAEISEDNPIVAVQTNRVTQDQSRWSVLSGIGFGYQKNNIWTWRGRTLHDVPEADGTFKPGAKPGKGHYFKSPIYSFPGTILSSIVLAGRFDDGVDLDNESMLNAGFGYLASTAMFGFRQQDSYDYLKPISRTKFFSLDFGGTSLLSNDVRFESVACPSVVATMGMGHCYNIYNQQKQVLKVDDPDKPSTVSWMTAGQGSTFLVRFVAPSLVRISYGSGHGYGGTFGKPLFYYGLTSSDAKGARLVVGSGDTLQLADPSSITFPLQNRDDRFITVSNISLNHASNRLSLSEPMFSTVIVDIDFDYEVFESTPGDCPTCQVAFNMGLSGSQTFCFGSTDLSSSNLRHATMKIPFWPEAGTSFIGMIPVWGPCGSMLRLPSPPDNIIGKVIVDCVMDPGTDPWCTSFCRDQKDQACSGQCDRCNSPCKMNPYDPDSFSGDMWCRDHQKDACPNEC